MAEDDNTRRLELIILIQGAGYSQSLFTTPDLNYCVLELSVSKIGERRSSSRNVRAHLPE